MNEHLDAYEDNTINPLDSVEDVLNDHNWVYARTNHDELIVEVAGKACSYKMLFVWQEQMNALQLCCQYDTQILSENLSLTAMALMDMNSDLWMGHFEIEKSTAYPLFRYTSLIRSSQTKSEYEHIEDLVDISLTQCERYQAIFQLLSNTVHMDEQTLSFAMMDTAGES